MFKWIAIIKVIQRRRRRSMAEHTFTYEELNKTFNSIKGKTLGEIDKNNVFKRAETNPKITGIAGDVIEQSVLGYPADTKNQPDLTVDGDDVELKCTGLKRVKKSKKNTKANRITLEAKEPMSITAVSPNAIIDQEFETSTLWHKLEKMLLVYYLYDSEKTVQAADYAKFSIQGSHFNKFDDSEKQIIENDWTVVRDFIRNVHENDLNIDEEYPKISKLRSEMMYMDTAPKWPNRPRFRLKRAFVSTIIQKELGADFEPLVGDANFGNYKELDAILHEKTEQFRGQSILEIATTLGVDLTKSGKAICEQIVTKMFGAEVGKIRKIENFAKMDVLPKTLILSDKGGRTEDTKFDRIDFAEWTDPRKSFEESDVYSFFSEKVMLFVVFKEPYAKAPLKEVEFQGFKRIMFSDEFLNSEVKQTWEDVRELVNENKLTVTTQTDKNGQILYTPKTGLPKTETNFPKSSNHAVFLRGTGKDATDKTLELNGLTMYQQQFWIKGKLMVEMLDNEEYI